MGQCGDSSTHQERKTVTLKGTRCLAQVHRLWTWQQQYQELLLLTPASFGEIPAGGSNTPALLLRLWECQNLTPHLTLHVPRKLDIIFLSASSPNSLVQNPQGSILLSSISCLQWFNGGKEEAMQGIHADFYLRGFREKETISVQLQLMPLQRSRQHLGVCNVCIWACNCQVLLSIMHLMCSLQKSWPRKLLIKRSQSFSLLRRKVVRR